MNVDCISPVELYERMRSQPVTLVDVRSPAEFAHCRAAGAINIPLESLSPAALARCAGPGVVIHLICKSGARSRLAAASLRARGHQAVVNVDGGTDAWLAASLPIDRDGLTRA